MAFRRIRNEGIDTQNYAYMDMERPFIFGFFWEIVTRGILDLAGIDKIN